MRNDAGINGDAQRIEQIAWMLFLKVYDAKEQDWEFDDAAYVSIIPNNCRWADWAADDRSGSAMTGDKLLDLILCFLAERTADCPFPLIIITRHNSPPDLSVVNYFICKSVLDGFLRCEEIVALGLALNKLNRFAHILS